MVNTIANQALTAIFKKLKSQKDDDFAKKITRNGMLKMIQRKVGILNMKKANNWLESWIRLGYFRCDGSEKIIERCISIDRPGEWFDE